MEGCEGMLKKRSRYLEPQVPVGKRVVSGWWMSVIRLSIFSESKLKIRVRIACFLDVPVCC